MGPPIIITFFGEEEEVKRSLGVGDARVFGTVGQQIKDVVGVMREMSGGKESLRVGVQMWFNTPAFLLEHVPAREPADRSCRYRESDG